MTDTTTRIIPLLFSVGRVFHEQSDTGRPDVVTMLRLHTLRYVKETGHPLMKDVADYLSVTPSSATALITSLVNANLLRRHADRRDRRAIRLSLTPRGRAYLAKGLRGKRERIRSVLRRLNAQEQRQLVHILQKLTHSIHTQDSV